MNPCLAYSYRLLSRYPKTVKQWRQKMKEKEFTTYDIAQAEIVLLQKHILDDMQYTISTIQSEVIRKGKNPFLVKQKLRQKGIDDEIIGSQLDMVSEEIDAGRLAKLQRLIEKMQMRGADTQKIMQACLRQGFSFSLIKKYLVV